MSSVFVDFLVLSDFVSDLDLAFVGFAVGACGAGVHWGSYPA
jgi:hypothetical protein